MNARFISAWVVAASLVTVGCTPLQAETRVERGTVLGTFDRKVELPGHRVDAALTVEWPRLHVDFQRISVCREEKVEVYLEQLITERRSPSAAPTLSAGLVNTVVGGTLLLARPLFSEVQPIDSEGRRGPSTRQVMTGFGVALVALGLPAAIAGGVNLARAGEERVERKVEDVISLKEATCGAQATSGSVELILSTEAEQDAARPLQNGRLTLEAAEMSSLPVRGFVLQQDVALLDELEEAQLAAFRLCASVLLSPLPSPPASAEEKARVGEWLGKARRCERELPESPAEVRIAELERMLAE